MDRAFKIGVWFALAAVVGLLSSRGNPASPAPSIAKAGAAARGGDAPAAAAITPRR